MRRDFRERLSCLELTYQQVLVTAHQHEGLRTNRHILHFARVTRTEQLFPAMDNRPISVLTDSSVEPPLSFAPHRAQAPSLRQFRRITQAILERTCWIDRRGAAVPLVRT